MEQIAAGLARHLTFQSCGKWVGADGVSLYETELDARNSWVAYALDQVGSDPAEMAKFLASRLVREGMNGTFIGVCAGKARLYTTREEAARSWIERVREEGSGDESLS